MGMNMEKWMLRTKKADFDEIGRRFGIDPVIARLIRNRDLVSDEEIQLYLNGTRKDLYSPWLMKDMEKAVNILEKKIEEKKKIRIIGDYDIDGVTSTCILLKGFRRLGACVDTYIPNRIKDGYGININLIEKAKEDEIDTIVTCDNGISAAKEVAYAKELGMTVIVTDHHDIPYQDTEEGRQWIIPEADAVVNPKQADCPYPNKKLCGAVAAWKLIWALNERKNIPQEETLSYTELAAVATVGDVMDLQGENRVIVKEGLKQLMHTKNPGLRALIRVNNLEDAKITAYHIGFVLGPCINASGRLDTAARALELLCEEDETKAAKLAGDLLALNQSRKDMTEQGKALALETIENSEMKDDRVLVVFLPDCHESLAGIIAGRIREEYNKPSFVLTRGETFVKGSGRSIEEYSMYDGLVECADLLEMFGGHPMAAGLSIKEENIDAFRKRLNERCTLTEQDLVKKIRIDVAMPTWYVSRSLVRQINLLEPFGKGNEKPLFAQKGLRVWNPRVFGKNRNVVKMSLEDEAGRRFNAVYFGEADRFVEYTKEHKKIAIAYYPEINTYQGRESLQMIVRNYC